VVHLVNMSIKKSVVGKSVRPVEENLIKKSIADDVKDKGPCRWKCGGQVKTPGGVNREEGKSKAEREKHQQLNLGHGFEELWQAGRFKLGRLLDLILKTQLWKQIEH